MGAAISKQRKTFRKKLRESCRTQRKFPYGQIVSCDKNHLENNYSVDLVQLLNTFPMEVWFQIFDNLFHSSCFNSINFENTRNASLFFERLLIPKRVQYMSPKVLEILENHYPHLNEEVHLYSWIVPNFFQVQQCERLVAEKKLIIDTTDSSSCPSKWQIGLKLVTQENVTYLCPYIKLLETKSSQKAVRIMLDMSAPLVASSSCYFVPIVKIFKEGESCDVAFISCPQHYRQPHTEYWHKIESDGSVRYAIILSIRNYFL